MTKRAKTTLIIAATLLSIAGVAYVGSLAYLIVGPSMETRQEVRAFESAKWKAKALDGDVMWPTRLRMVDDLLKSDALTGAQRSEVISLLGPPDDTSYFKEWSMVYWLGPERGAVRIDSEWLVLRLDEASTVREVRIVRD